MPGERAPITKRIGAIFGEDVAAETGPRLVSMPLPLARNSLWSELNLWCPAAAISFPSAKIPELWSLDQQSQASIAVAAVSFLECLGQQEMRLCVSRFDIDSTPEPYFRGVESPLAQRDDAKIVESTFMSWVEL